jgi:hypothetical protein
VKDVQTLRCGIPRQIRSVLRKWIEDKQNERVLRQTNNQALVVGPTKEWRCARTTSERTFVKVK